MPSAAHALLGCVCTHTHPSTRLLPQRLISLRDLSTASRETEREAEHRLSCIGEADTACGLNSGAAEESCVVLTGLVLCFMDCALWTQLAGNAGPGSWSSAVGEGRRRREREKGCFSRPPLSCVVWLLTEGPVLCFCLLVSVVLSS